MKEINDIAHIFDEFNEGILIINTDAKIVYGNKAYCDFINMDISEIIEKN